MFDRSPLMKIPPLMRDDRRSVVDHRNHAIAIDRLKMNPHFCTQASLHDSRSGRLSAKAEALPTPTPWSIV